MFRIAVVQNQSESLRAGYADVARNFSQRLRMEDYEFVSFDGANVTQLFEASSPFHLSNFDAIFISTNSTSDIFTRKVFEDNVSQLDDFTRSGKGVYFGYQKKMSKNAAEAEASVALLPEPYRITMLNRPKSEPDSSAGMVSISAGSRDWPGGFLLLNSPHEVSEELIMSHCRENDFKSHVYRAVLQPENEAAFETVLEDKSYDDYRRLLLVNRSSVSGERVVVSTIAVDWEGHWRLLENIIRYIAEGVPRVALIEHPKEADLGFEFIRSTAKLLRVTNCQYKALSMPHEFAKIHDVYVVSSRWKQSNVEEFWRSVSGEKVRFVQPAAYFRRLYHLGDPARECTSLTRYVNYTSIDVLVNDSLLWLEQQFRGGFWAGGFWNTHDVIVMMDALDLNVRQYIPGILQDIVPHLAPGGYDAVMGPSCGLLNLLNRLSINYETELEEEGFSVEKRSIVASWVLDNLEGQSDVARQVAARALFGKGGEKVLSSLRESGREDEITALRGIIRNGLNVALDRLHGFSEIDLVRLVQLTCSVPALESVLNASMEELKKRQNSNGLWVSVGRTANILTSILEIEDELSSLTEDKDWNESVSRGIEAIRGSYDAELCSWGGIIQDTAMCVHALGLYRARYDVESQELFETIESDTRASNIESSVGRARIDLGDLFARELRREKKLKELKTKMSKTNEEIDNISKKLTKEHNKASIFQILGGACFLLLIALLVSFGMSEMQALKNVLTSTGSILGLVVGAIIAVPITLLLSPSSGENNECRKQDEVN